LRSRANNSSNAKNELRDRSDAGHSAAVLEEGGQFARNTESQMVAVEVVVQLAKRLDEPCDIVTLSLPFTWLLIVSKRTPGPVEPWYKNGANFKPWL
jgi:hypothetical protein